MNQILIMLASCLCKSCVTSFFPPSMLFTVNEHQFELIFSNRNLINLNLFECK